MASSKELSADMNYEQVDVECYSGHKANERPIAFTYHGHRLEISEIMDRWYEGSVNVGRPQIDYFKIRTADGQVFLLRYLSELVWENRTVT